jgi:hypothetical protein
VLRGKRANDSSEPPKATGLPTTGVGVAAVSFIGVNHGNGIRGGWHRACRASAKLRSKPKLNATNSGRDSIADAASLLLCRALPALPLNIEFGVERRRVRVLNKKTRFSSGLELVRLRRLRPSGLQERKFDVAPLLASPLRQTKIPPDTSKR